MTIPSGELLWLCLFNWDCGETKKEILLNLSFWYIYIYIYICCSRIGGVMVGVLVSSVVDRGFEPQLGKTKDYKIGICCFSAKHAALRSKSKDWLCLSGVSCLPTDCCFTELGLQKSNSACWSSTKQTSSSYQI